MKKLLLSSFVIVAFLGYAFYLRVKGVNENPVLTPSPTSQTAPRQTPSPTSVSTTTPVQQAPTVAQTGYKDGTYTGDAADAFYGNIQVQATIRSGKITNVQFLQAPNDRDTSIQINAQADPILAQEAIQNQTAQVDIVSGATASSQAFVQSLQSALNKAKS